MFLFLKCYTDNWLYFPVPPLSSPM